MRARALLLALSLLSVFAAARVASGEVGLGEWAGRRTALSPAGGEERLGGGRALGGGAGLAAQATEKAIPAQVVDFTPDAIGVRTFPTTDYTDLEIGPREATTDWRVISGTGNAAEIWITATSKGRILDLGGRYVNYSDDYGQTWKSVRPLEPLINAEGSVLGAPNGDVVAVTWDPYSGDRVLTYKYNAAEDRWYYMYNLLHTPFWDRPGIDVVPGDFTDLLGARVPYITFINGFPHDPWQYSTDGIHYPHISSRSRDASSTTPISTWLDVEPAPMLDWVQAATPLDQSLIPPFAPLGDGRAWSRSGNTNYIFTSSDMKWHRFSFPDDEILTGALQVDSRGWLHNVAAVAGGFQYRTSTDGGRTWSTIEVEGVSPGDFRANAAAGVAAVWAIKGTQDLVYKFDITEPEPELIRKYVVGLGDDCRCQGIGFYGIQGGHRFDFSSIAIFPDGRVAVSFMDSQTKMKFPTLGLDVVAPALAVELDTHLPAPG